MPAHNRPCGRAGRPVGRPTSSLLARPCRGTISYYTANSPPPGKSAFPARWSGSGAAGRPRTGRWPPRPTRSGWKRARASGIDARRSHDSRTRRRRPCPSAPRTSADGLGEVDGVVRLGRVGARPIVHTPASLSSPIALAMFTTLAILTWETAPAEALAAAPSRRAAWRVCRTTPSPPEASTVLRIAPRLCGSSMPSSTTMSGGPWAERDEFLHRIVRGVGEIGRDALVHARRAPPGRDPAPDQRTGTRTRFASAIARIAAHALARARHPRAPRGRVRLFSASRTGLMPYISIACSSEARIKKPVVSSQSERQQSTASRCSAVLQASCFWLLASVYCFAPQPLRKSRGAFTAAENRRHAARRRQLGARVNRRHREVEFGPARFPGQRHADRVKQVLALLARSPPSPARLPPGRSPGRAAAQRPARARAPR